jgi:hypothetical protein
MAAGAGFYDAQGVWQYGETDNIGTLFSDFMNVAPVSISTQFVADRSRLTALETITDAPTVYVANSEAARNTHWGTPTTGSTQLALQNLGATTIRTDLGITERYFATYNVSSNPAGSRVPGWFPVGNEAAFMGTASRSTNSGTTYAPGSSGFAYTEVADTLAWHNPSTNPDRITTNREGIYRVTVATQWAGNATGSRNGQIQRNSSELVNFFGTGATVRNYSMSAVAYMNGTTDYFNLAGWLQDSTVALTSNVQVLVEYIRPAIVAV